MIYFSKNHFSEVKKLKIENSSKCMTCKEGQFEVVELLIFTLLRHFPINFNAQDVNGMTPFG